LSLPFFAFDFGFSGVLIFVGDFELLPAGDLEALRLAEELVSFFVSFRGL